MREINRIKGKIVIERKRKTRIMVWKTNFNRVRNLKISGFPGTFPERDLLSLS